MNPKKKKKGWAILFHLSQDVLNCNCFEGLNKSEAGFCGGKEVNSYKGF